MSASRQSYVISSTVMPTSMSIFSAELPISLDINCCICPVSPVTLFISSPEVRFDMRERDMLSIFSNVTDRSITITLLADRVCRYERSIVRKRAAT